MKIDKTKLIELLVEKTGMEPEEIKDQLDQLVKRIIDAAERGKALEIKEFGLFYFDEKGDLKFDTAKELSTEINFKYAGMEPVELKPPRDSAPEEADKEIVQDTKDDKDEEDDIFGLDPFDSKDEPADPFEIADEQDDEIEEPKSKNPVISKADKVERESDPFSGLLGDASSKLTDSDLGISEEDLTQEEKKLPIFEPFQEEATPEKKEPAIKKKIKEEKKSRDPILVVMGVVLIFVLIAAAFFIIPALFQGSEQPQPDQEIVTEQIPEEALDAPEILTPLEPEEETEVSEEVIEEEPAIEAEPEQPLYGLTGDLVEAANDGFSIVLHSLAREENARNQAAALASEGYRVLVNSRIVNGRTVWRVSIGQFPTIEEAQARARELPSPYNSNNFIQRIQTN